MKNKAISSASVEYINGIISGQVKIVDLWLEGKWLVAALSSGVKLKVLNNPFK